MRRSPDGRPGLAADRRAPGPGPRRTPRAPPARRCTPNAAHTRPTIAGVVVSSRAIPTRSASTRRRLRPRSRAAATTASARPGTRTVIVSKNSRVTDLHPAGLQARGQGGGQARGPAGRCAAGPSGPWYTAYIDGHHRQQHLGGADVRRGLLPADVLLAGLQGEAQRRAAGRVHRDAHEPARQRALERLLRGQEAGVRPAEAERDAEALGAAHRHVRAQLAGRRQQRQRQQVGGRHDQPARRRGPARPRPQVPHRAGRARVLDQHAEGVGQVDGGVPGVADPHLDAERLGPRLDHRDRLGVAVGVDDEGGASRAGPPGAPGSSPRPRRCPRRASRRWRCPWRTGP